MNLSKEDFTKIQAFDKISIEVFKELSEKDLVVERLKGNENNTEGVMQTLVTEIQKLRSDNYQLQHEIRQLSSDLGKLSRIIERQSLIITSDYEFQQIKNRHPA